MEKCDVVMITALPVEFQAVLEHLQDVQEVMHPSGTVYQYGIFHGEQSAWRIAVAEMGSGETAAAVAIIAERMLSFFQPKFQLFVGIAGGLKDVNLGDVVAATTVYGYETGKAAQDFEPRPEVWHASYVLEQRAQAEVQNSNWLARLGDPHPDPAPRAFVGVLAAGGKVISSMQSSSYQLLRTHYGDALAIEMEGHSVLHAVRPHSHVQALVIRGISDLIDRKAKADMRGTQESAARHAAAFAFEMLATLHKEALSQQFTPGQEVFDEEESWFQTRLRKARFSSPHLPRWEEIVHKRSLQDGPLEWQSFQTTSEERSDHPWNGEQQQFAHACQVCGEYIDMLRQVLEASGGMRDNNWNWDRTKVQELEGLIDARLHDAHLVNGDLRSNDQWQLIALLLETLESLLSPHPRRWSPETHEVVREMAIQVCQDLLSNLADLQSQMVSSDFSAKWQPFLGQSKSS